MKPMPSLPPPSLASFSFHCYWMKLTAQGQGSWIFQGQLHSFYVQTNTPKDTNIGKMKRMVCLRKDLYTCRLYSLFLSRDRILCFIQDLLWKWTRLALLWSLKNCRFLHILLLLALLLLLVVGLKLCADKCRHQFSRFPRLLSIQEMLCANGSFEYSWKLYELETKSNSVLSLSHLYFFVLLFY